MNINPLNDAENARQFRNQTASQKKKSLCTKEGVLVKSNIKEENN
jgi:hypothetical protein